MNRVTFLHHPRAENPSAILWGIRIDDTDLREYVAEATRGLWREEFGEETPGKETPEEEDRSLLSQHEGIPVGDIPAPGHHFTNGPAPTPVLGCGCGIWECGPLFTRITTTPTTVAWSAFSAYEGWGELAMGPYVFPREAYEAALAHPLVLDEDPLAARLT